MKAAHLVQLAIFLTSILGLSGQTWAEELPATIPASFTSIQKTVSGFGSAQAPCPTEGIASGMEPVLENDEPLICKEPVKAVCGTSSTYLIEREKKLKELQKQVYERSMAALTKTLGKDPRMFTPSDYLSPNFQKLPFLKFQEIERQTFEALKDLGWSKEKVAQLIQKIKSVELDRIHPGDGVDPGKKKLLENAPWITSDTLERLPEDKRNFALFGWDALCGNDGMELQAFASRVAEPERILSHQLRDSDPAVFTVCPGLLLEAAADLDGPEKLAFIFGHELGHVVQPEHPIAGTLKIYSDADKKKVADAEKAYQKAVSEAEMVCPKLKGCFVRKAVFSDESFINSCDIERVTEACDKDHELAKAKVAAVSSAGRARQQIIDQMTAPTEDTNRDRAMLSCLKTYDLAEMNDGDRQVKAFEKKLSIELKKSSMEDRSEIYRIIGVEKIKTSVSQFEAEYGRKPDAVDLHQDELIADYWGTIALATSLKDIPNTRLRQRVAIGNLRPHCHSDAKTKDVDFEQHPPDAYRIVRSLSNPEVRAALGCQSTPIKPWCER